MRLLMVTDTFSPDINGVARSLRHFALGMLERGHSVQVVSTAVDESVQVEKHQVASVPLPGYSTLRVGLASPRWFRELIAGTSPNVLYVAVESVMGISAVWAARQSGVPVVSGFHTNFHSYAGKYGFGVMRPVVEGYLRKFHNQTALTVAPSQHTARQIRAMGIKDVSVVGRGVNTDLFSPEVRSDGLRAEWGASGETPVVIYVGRVAAEKNLALLERAWEAILKIEPTAVCVVVGDGPLLPSLKLRRPEWVCAGEKTGTELATYYASGDVFVFPSLSETFGNVVIEAMASGLVVVAFDYAAAAEHIEHGLAGFLAPVDDEVAFLSQAKDAVQNWRNDNIRTSARATARNLSWSSQVQQFESLLQETIQAPNSPS